MWHGPTYVVTLRLCVDIPHLNSQKVTINAEACHRAVMPTKRYPKLKMKETTTEMRVPPAQSKMR